MTWKRGPSYEKRLSAAAPRRLRRGRRYRLELGCGKKKASIEGDLIGVDRHPFKTVDIVTDLDAPGPWTWAEDGSCALIVAHQVLEHLRNLIPAMNEIWRISDEDAYVETVVPYGASKGALQDPTHVRFFTETTWRYWEPGFVDSFSSYGIEGEFAICGQEWQPMGNLWTLLRPLKTATDMKKWSEMRKISDDPVRFPAPAWLLEREKVLMG